jgi:riboflavin-specific deaminase-like protein
VVADSTLRLPLDTHVLTDGAARTIIATTERADPNRLEAVRATGAEVLVAGQEAGRVDLHHLLQRLGALGIQSLLVEGGRGIITSLLSRHLVDRMIICIAPKLIGEGIGAIGDLHILTMDEAITFTEMSFRTVGEDLIFDGYFERPGNRPLVPPSP